MTGTSRSGTDPVERPRSSGTIGQGALAILMVASALVGGAGKLRAAPAPTEEVSGSTSPLRPAAARPGVELARAETARPVTSAGELAYQRETRRIQQVGLALRLSSIGSILLAGGAFAVGVAYLVEGGFTEAFRDEQEPLTEEEKRILARARLQMRIGLGFVVAGAALTLSSVVLLSVGFHFDDKARERARPRGWRWAVAPWIGEKSGGLSVTGSF